MVSTETVPADTYEKEVESSCRNCNSSLHGRFCSHCGQQHKHLDPTLHDLFHEMLHEFAHLDGKIFKTLKQLLLYPGRLSAEFLEGKRARYIGPLRLYLTTSLIFFILASHESFRGVNENPSDHEIDVKVLDKESHKTDLEGKFSRSIKQALEEPELFKHIFLANTSKVMFVIVPLFALGLRIAYHNRRYRYPGYIYFSLHYHSWLFLMMSLYIVFGVFKAHFLQHAWGVLFLPGMSLYLFIAQKKVFGGSSLKTLLRMMFLAMFYFPCLLVGVGVAALITLWSIK